MKEERKCSLQQREYRERCMARAREAESQRAAAQVRNLDVVHGNSWCGAFGCSRDLADHDVHEQCACRLVAHLSSVRWP